MNRLMLILSFFLCCGSLNAQDSVLDSLKKALDNQSLHDTTKIDLMKKIGEQEPIFRISYWDTIAMISKQNLQKHEAPVVDKFYNKTIASSTNNIGYIYKSKGNIPQALLYYHESLKARELLEDQIGIAQTLVNIGMVHFDLNETADALTAFERAIRIQRENNDNNNLAIALNNVGLVYQRQKNYEKALKYFKEGLELQTKEYNFSSMATLLNNIGLTYHKLARKQYPKKLPENDTLVIAALTHFNQALSISDSINDQVEKAYSYCFLGDLYADINSVSAPDNAKKYGALGLVAAEKLGYPDLIDRAAALLYDIAKTNKDYKQALKMYEYHIQHRDSVKNEKNKKEAIRAQTKYEFEKAQLIKEQEEQEAIRKEKEATGRRNSLQYSIILVGIVAVFGLILTLGFVSVSPKFAEGLIFFAFLIFFEFLLVLTDPYVEDITGGAPVYKLLANAILAGAIFPAHAFFERILKKKLIRNKRS